MSAKSQRSNDHLSVARSVVPLTRESLARLRLKAVRRGVWFRSLKHNERQLLDLTMRVVEKVHSFLLAKVVSQIVNKLCEVMESRIFRLMRTEGRSMAENLSLLAQAWGYRAAKSWVKDRGFVQFLVINKLSCLKT